MDTDSKENGNADMSGI